MVRSLAHAVPVAEPFCEHRTAVVRVDIPSGDGDLLIQLVEVGPSIRDDRVIGRATDSDGAWRLLVCWLDHLGGRPGPGPTTSPA